MVAITELTNYINDLLAVELFSDYAPNGLQVAGTKNVNTLITGVSANQALLDAAVNANGDTVLVHHGFFWKGEDPCIVGIKRQRIYTLLKSNLNLLAYHLPLDAHPELGNNAKLAKRLQIKVTSVFDLPGAPGLIFMGELPVAISAAEFTAQIAKVLNRQPLHIDSGKQKIKTVVWCTGAAPDAIQQAIELKADAYITGEIAERSVSIAKEAGVHFYAAGHHATERYGVQALGEHLAEKFNLTHQFIDIDNPV